ncbi:HVO_2922 family protein [Haladaptatus salinisoli]|uniref:HVO_2922 family protein n=1 Tax=Haladaptatus salinisoli TaxID=2884876 RepID=UPI001D0AD674|nr:HVO_2922 family protein [Haladaptatus salinisoli]
MNSDSEYRVAIHPNLRAKVTYDADDGALRLTVDYRRDGEWDEPAGGLELRGRRISMTSDGESLFDRDVSIESLERYGSTLARFARRLTDATGAAEPESWPVSVTQNDGSVVEALRPPAQASFEVYEDKSGDWRWRLVHRNGNVIADGGGGYSSKQAAKKGVRSVKRNALGAPVEEL